MFHSTADSKKQAWWKVNSDPRGHLATWCTVYETPALKCSITASRQLIASPHMSHANTLTSLRTVTWSRSWQRKNTPSRSKTASRAAAFISKRQGWSTESQTWQFSIRPSISTLVLFIVARGWSLSQHAPGERQDRSVIYHRALAVLYHSQQRWITQRRVVAIRPRCATAPSLRERWTDERRIEKDIKEIELNRRRQNMTRSSLEDKLGCKNIFPSTSK